MSNNHLIIGLGGTGGKIIRAFRKAVFQKFRKENPEGLNIGYLYMDSSSEMMGIDDPSWKILGKSVQLGKNSQLKISGADLLAVMENVQNYPGIKNWIGDRSHWRDILNTVVGETLGGQKRRLGRFLFANNADKFQAQLQELTRSVQRGASTSSVTFHICCGLAGGTGSGSLIDVISIIRKTYNDIDPDKYRILLYALLPETHPHQGWDTGNYHSNGYAALAELNALSIGRFLPCDVSGRSERYQLQDPFNGCYLFTNENENGIIVDVDRELPNIVADFLYQKTVAIRDIQNWDSLRRIENFENLDITPETAPGNANPERSRRFLAFGIKRLAIPEEEIREYLTYSFARQAGLQFQYNNWQDSLGFHDEPKNQDFHEPVRQADALFRWKLSDDHLCLSLGILPVDAGNKKWKTIQNEWQEIIPNFKGLVRESSDGKAWTDDLEKLCEKRFAEDFRGLGVPAFYKTKSKAKKEIVREIRRGIEAELFESWRNGVQSMHDTGRLLDALASATDERLQASEDRIVRYKERMEGAAEQLKNNRSEWARISTLSGLFGKRDRVFDAHAVFLQDFYVNRTWFEAWQFAKELLQDWAVELTSLKSEVDRCAQTIHKAVESFGDRVAERCNDDGFSDLQKHLIRFYDSALVKEITRRFIRNENEQRTQTNRVRLALVAKLGESPDFRVFNERIGVSEFVDALELECEENVRVAHDTLILSTKEKLLGVSIIDRLKDRYGGDAAGLRKYISDLVAHAGNYLGFSPMEVQKRGPGIPDSPSCLSNFTVILPKAPEHTAFVAELKEALQSARRLGVNVLETDASPQEITMISITHLFPLRFIKPLPLLRSKYDQRVGGRDAARAKLEIHIEGDGSQFPSLFVPTTREIVQDAVPYLLLAKNMGLLHQGKNVSTGVPELQFIAKDKHGFDTDPRYLGPSLMEAPGHLDAAGLNQIRDEVDKVLGSPEFLHVERRGEVIRAMQADIEAIKAERGLDAVYKQFLDGAKKAAAILEMGR